MTLVMGVPAPMEAESSQPVSISGTEVGQLDSTQASRVLRVAGAKLSFANYDPLAASAVHRPFSKHDHLSRAKRIVIETLPTGESSWRWVPRAKGVVDVTEEGRWPRVIDICGSVCPIFVR